MQEYHDSIDKIKSILKDNIRGTTVTDIAKMLDMSRTSVGKYLDILLVSGVVEVKKFGSAKVYFLSDRIPLSTMLNFTSDQIIVLDRNFVILQVNQSFLDSWHLEREEITGITINETQLPFLVPDFFTLLKTALNGNENKIELDFDYETNQYFLDIKFIPTTFETGYPGITVIIEDNSEKKLQELALQISQRRMNSIIENSFDIVWESDLNGFLTYVSYQAYEMYGYKVEELVNKPFSVFLRDEIENKRIGEDYIKFMKQKAKINDYHVLGRMKNGNKMVMELNAVPKYNEKEELIGYLGTTRDITEKYQIQKDLEVSQKMYKTLVENLPIVSWELTKDGKFSYISPNVKQILGYTAEEILDAGEKLLLDRIHEKDKQKVETQILEIFDKNLPFNIEYRIQKKDGDWIWVHDKGILVRKEGGQSVVYGIIEDISDKKEQINNKMIPKSQRIHI